MKLAPKEFLEIYKLMDVSPVKYDCGALCSNACCNVSSSEFGIYLLPGEIHCFSEKESWFVVEKQNPKQYDFPASWQNDTVYFLLCSGSCPRHKRPIQCRSFPLAPHIDFNERLHVIWETLELPYKCPLIENDENLNLYFITNIFWGWKKLIKNKLIKDLVVYDSYTRILEGSKIIPLKSDY